MSAPALKVYRNEIHQPSFTVPSLRTAKKKSCCQKFAHCVKRAQEAFARSVSNVSFRIVKKLRGMLYRFRRHDIPSLQITYPTILGREPKVTAALNDYKKFEIYSPQTFEYPALSNEQLECAQTRLKLLETDLNKPAGPFFDLDVDATKPIYKEAQELRTLIETASHHKATRGDFGRAEWNAIDRVNLSLLKEHIQNFTFLIKENVFAEQQKSFKNALGLNYCETQLAEILAKGLVYIEKLDGQKITLPKVEADGSFKEVVYTIQSFNFGDNLPGYILESEEPGVQPWLLARGTATVPILDEKGREMRQGSNESFKADVYDPSGLAEDAVIKAMVHRPQIQVEGGTVQGLSLIDRFKIWQKAGIKLKLAGHSLGGYLINETSVRFYKQIDCAYGFSPPGVSKKLGKLWLHKIEKEAKLTGRSKEELNKKIVNISAEGDPVPAGGRMLIGYQLAVAAEHSRDLNPVEHHVHFGLNKSFEVAEIDVKRENRRRSRRFAESIRMTIGRVFRFIHMKFSKKQVPDWRINRHNYRLMLECHKAMKRQERELAAQAATA